FFVIFFSEVFVAGISWFILGFIIVIAIIGLVLIYAFFPHFAHRINQFLNNDNYQLDKALDAIKESNFLFGGHSNNLKTVVPDIHTDFIFTAVIEEIGPVLSFLIILVFLALIIHIIYRLKLKEDTFIILSGIGVTSYIAFQIIYNLASTFGILPTKGMTLPFISYGGSSFISSCFAIGIILSLLQDQNLRR
ncbi:MAG: FtsW/RodA/SpoVE family cell cycle protein, partial [Alphaproteobacteria bacterium]|nr:FtsW/RodA/SpoVE family cell cycle protein [Alphaproteobacteria bacterium]